MTTEICERTLNALLEGDDIAHCKDEAREFLRALMEITPREVFGVCLPVARQLCAYKGWQERVNLFELRDYCAERVSVLRYLNELETTATFDPAADYLVGVVVNIANTVGLIPVRTTALRVSETEY